MIKEEMVRVVVYLPKQSYRRLRAKLIMMGKSVSQWVREMIKTFLGEN